MVKVLTNLDKTGSYSLTGGAVKRVENAVREVEDKKVDRSCGMSARKGRGGNAKWVRYTGP